MYELIYASVQGASHIKHGIPCEDSGKVIGNDSYKAFAVSDGHGDPNCARSAKGSALACDIALGQLEAFYQSLTENNWEGKLLEGGHESARIIRQLITSIITKWKNTVCSDLEANPLTDEEKAACKEYLAFYEKGEYTEHLYGATLIAGIITNRYALLLQQGDGRCIVLHEDGTMDMPIPWDENCVGNVTTSLCEADSVQRCRCHVIDMAGDKIIACAAGTDGVEDSFSSMETMYTFYRNRFIYAAENEVTGLNLYLEETLPELSARGSGDDITICGVVDAERVLLYKDSFLRENEKISLRDKRFLISEKLKSVNGMGKLDKLKRDFEAKSVRYETSLEMQKKALAAYETAVKDRDVIVGHRENDSYRMLRKDKNTGAVYGIDAGKHYNKLVESLKLELDSANECTEYEKKELEKTEKEYRAFIAKKEDLEKELGEVEARLAELEGNTELSGSSIENEAEAEEKIEAVEETAESFDNLPAEELSETDLADKGDSD